MLRSRDRNPGDSWRLLRRQDGPADWLTSALALLPLLVGSLIANAQVMVEKTRLPGIEVWADYGNTSARLIAHDPDTICLAIQAEKQYQDPYAGCASASASRCRCQLRSRYNGEVYTIGHPFRGAHCPEGYVGKPGTYSDWQEWYRAKYTRWYGPGTLQCVTPFQVSEVDRTNRPHPSCRSTVGNPIDALRGTKRQSITLDVGLLGRPLVLTYDSSDLVQTVLTSPGEGYPVQQSNDFVRRTVAGTPGLPRGWFLSAFKRMHMGEYLGGHFRATKAVRGNGDVVSFEELNWYNTKKDSDVLDLAQWGPELLYYDALAGSLETYWMGDYNFSSALVSRIRHRDGSEVTHIYSDTATPVEIAPASRYLIAMVDDLGRRVSFRYSAPPNARSLHEDGRLDSITGADGSTVRFEYDQFGRLTVLTWADGGTRRFVYDDSRFPSALTGVVDERGIRIGTYAYNGGGQAIETSGAQGTGRHTVVHSQPPGIVMRERFDIAASKITRVFEWVDPGQVTVVKPNGAQHTIRSTLVNGAPMPVADDQPAGSGCNAATEARELDANGLATSVVDVAGYRRCMLNDPTRQLVKVQVEGLPSATNCAAVVQPAAPLPAGSRKVTHEWHPQWRLKTRTFEPGKASTFVYNGQPNPFRNGAIANCAPGLRKHADDSAVPLLCAEVAAATLDPDGSMGPAAALDTTAPLRSRQFTYNSKGRLTTATDERGAVTTYLYHPSDSPQARAGDLWQIVNPLGHRLTFERYDGAGRLLRQLDANGVATDFAYDPRGHLIATTIAGTTTVLERDPTGAIQRIVQPDGTWLRMHHDAAGRLEAVEDSAGNRVEYTLDSEGRRVEERAIDPNRQLRRTLARSFDALGRLALETGATP